MSNQNQFACGIYRRLAQAKGNIFLSPFSVRAALTRALIGARGDTDRQMREVLGYGPEPHAEIARLMHQQEASLRECVVEGIQLVIANKLWAQQDFPFNADYLETVGTDSVEIVDFISDPDAVAELINAWIAENTNNLIRNMVSPGAFDAWVRLVIANAIYFKGLWAQQFKPEKTYTDEFKVAPGKSVQAPMMHQVSNFNYLEAEALKVLEMPYKGDRLSMLVFLPAEKGTIQGIEERLSPANLRHWMARLHPEKVRVTFPKFKITWGTKELRSILQRMGMCDAFTRQADFSGIEPTRWLYISNVLHKAFVEVNEEGTEAAAATVVVMRGLGVELIFEFKADHPFVFAIYDKETENILFIGRVVDPTA